MPWNHCNTIQNTWNGTAWTEVADLANQVDNTAGAGTTSSALDFGGYVQLSRTTEEWTVPEANSTITVS